MSYRHLNIHERESIARLYRIGNMARIAVVIGRSRATVKREIDRNGYRDEQGRWRYDAQRAQQKSEKRKAYPGCGKGYRFSEASWIIALDTIRKPYVPPFCRSTFRSLLSIQTKYTYHYPPPFDKRHRFFRSDDKRIRWRTERGEQRRKPYHYRWRSPFDLYLYFQKKTATRNREREPQWFLKRKRESKEFWKKEFCDPAYYKKQFLVGVNTQEAQPKRKILKRITSIPFPSRLRPAYSPATGVVQGRSMSEAEQNGRFLKNEPSFHRDKPVLFLKSA